VSVMTDDPRDILKAAGVECPELDTFLCGRGPSEWEDDDELDAAFLALARLVAKYKWQRDYVRESYMEPEGFYVSDQSLDDVFSRHQS